MKNKELARLFGRIADALEIKGEDTFKVLAYQKASRILDDLAEDVETLVAENRLRQVPGIGSGLASKIEEFLRTGKMEKYGEALSGIPEGLLPMLEVQGLGGKTIRLVWKELGVKDLAGLKRVIQNGSLAKLRGLGEKRAANILKGIELHERAQERISIFEAMTVVEEVLAYLGQNSRFRPVRCAGCGRPWAISTSWPAAAPRTAGSSSPGSPAFPAFSAS